MVFKPQTFRDRPPLAEIEAPTQATVEAQVAQALARAASVDASQVAVTVVEGVVTLDGIVRASQEIDRVAEVAFSVRGVTTLQNRVRLTGTRDVS